MNNKKLSIEFTVGLFMLLGFGCLAYLSIGLARKDFSDTDGYAVRALFSNVGGLAPGASVEIAGVPVGRVKEIALKDYDAEVILTVRKDIRLQTDTIASVKTNGLFGERFVEITPGADDSLIEPGGKIFLTEPAMNFEVLISKFIHGNVE
jgi:phospholipid/cholesterol/gamma-HCH transport system substrate-binding protein